MPKVYIYTNELFGGTDNETLHADEENHLTRLKNLTEFGGAGVEDKIGDELFGGQGNDALAGSNRHDVMPGRWRKVSPSGTGRMMGNGG